MIEFHPMNLQQLLNQKFLDWQSQYGERKLLKEFAAWLGVSQSSLSGWMSGANPNPSLENVKILANKLGPEIYDILGLERPDPGLAYLERIWDSLPPDAQRALREEAERYALENQRKLDDPTRGSGSDSDETDLVDVAQGPTEKDY